MTYKIECPLCQGHGIDVVHFDDCTLCGGMGFINIPEVNRGITRREATRALLAGVGAGAALLAIIWVCWFITGLRF